MRRIALLTLLSSLVFICQDSTAEAQWPKYRPPKIEKPQIPKPGPYQQKIINGGVNGATLGAEVGSEFGPYGSIAGGAMGAAFGAGYADYEHHRDKVNNYRTPPTAIFESSRGQLTLYVNGSRVGGFVKYPNGNYGNIVGNLTGNRIRFSWRNGNDQGIGELFLGGNGRRLNGWFQDKFGSRFNWNLWR